MAQKYNSSPSIDTFSIGGPVSLHIDERCRKSTAPARLFCKVIRKPQTDMHELQCTCGILSSKYWTIDLERLPATIDLQIGNNTIRITLTKAVGLIYEANPTAVLTPPPHCIPFQVVTNWHGIDYLPVQGGLQFTKLFMLKIWQYLRHVVSCKEHNMHKLEPPTY